jgi:hypothetical protein
MDKKTEIPGIYKRSEGILINKDTEALKAYKNRRLREKRLDILQTEVSTLKEDMRDIKSLLLQLVKSKDG